MAKTDRVDAAVLARMGDAQQTKASKPFDQRLEEMTDLLVVRRSLSKDGSAIITRAKALRSQLLIAQNTLRLRQIDAQLVAIDKALLILANDYEGFAAKLSLLKTISGISDMTDLILLIEMPEVGSLENRQTASLADLAPMARQSAARVGA